MVMALRKRVMRILKENNRRYLGILVLIILGSYTFIVAAGLAQNLANLVTTFTEEHRQEDLSFRADRVIPDREGLEQAAGVVIEDYLSFDARFVRHAPCGCSVQRKDWNTPAVIEGQEGSPGRVKYSLIRLLPGPTAIRSEVKSKRRAKPSLWLAICRYPTISIPSRTSTIFFRRPQEFGVGVIHARGLYRSG